MRRTTLIISLPPARYFVESLTGVSLRIVHCRIVGAESVTSLAARGRDTVTRGGVPMTTTPQTLTLAGEDYVVIRRDEYDRLRAAADEDAADVAAIQRVLDDPDETWAPAELVRRIVEGEHPVRVWRTHRGMTARALAAAAGIPSSYLSAIERGVKPGSVKALKGLATALDVPLDDLV